MGDVIELNPPPPPAERLVCAELPAPPNLQPLEVFVAGDMRFYLKSDVDARDRLIAEWIIAHRDSWFSCKSQLEWVSDYYEGQE